MASNPILDVNGETLDRLKTALGFTDKKSADGWAIRGNRMIFFWTEDPQMTPFPAPASMDRCAEIAWDWLQVASYPREPAHDGHNKRGWRCYREAWGRIDGFGYQSFVAIEPCWIMFGK